MLTEVHLGVGIAVLATNALTAIWGGVSWMRGAPSVVFWYLLRVAQAVVVLQVVLGLALLATGHHPRQGLHVLYGVLPLVVTLVTEGMRASAAEHELAGVEDPDALDRAERARIARRVVLRETGIMSIGALLILTLALRAAVTGGGF